MFCPHSNQDRRAISLNLVACPGSSGVELRGHEDGAALGIREQMRTSIALHGKAVAGSPVQHCLSAASQNCNIERFDLDLLQHLRGISGRSALKDYGTTHDRMSFEIEALQCPGAALLDLEWHCRERYDPSNVSDRICVGLLVREACQVAFNAVMPSNKRCRAGKPNVPIMRNQPAAGKRRQRLDRKDQKSNDSCKQRDKKL